MVTEKMDERLADQEWRLLSSGPPAPLLTPENVMIVVKEVRSWRRLGEHLLYMPESHLDSFQHQHGSDEACLKAVVERFLLGDYPYWQPSWREVIWALYKANEIHLADQIRSYAEPVQGTQ